MLISAADGHRPLGDPARRRRQVINVRRCRPSSAEGNVDIKAETKVDTQVTAIASARQPAASTYRASDRRPAMASRRATSRPMSAAPPDHPPAAASRYRRRGGLGAKTVAARIVQSADPGRSHQPPSIAIAHLPYRSHRSRARRHRRDDHLARRQRQRAGDRHDEDDAGRQHHQPDRRPRRRRRGARLRVRHRQGLARRTITAAPARVDSDSDDTKTFDPIDATPPTTSPPTRRTFPPRLHQRRGRSSTRPISSRRRSPASAPGFAVHGAAAHRRRRSGEGQDLLRHRRRPGSHPARQGAVDRPRSVGHRPDRDPDAQRR